MPNTTLKEIDIKIKEILENNFKFVFGKILPEQNLGNAKETEQKPEKQGKKH